jgi:hypothetical protein
MLTIFKRHHEQNVSAPTPATPTSSPRKSVKLSNGTPVVLSDSSYGTVTAGRLVGDAYEDSYGVWTLLLSDGRKFRSEGRLSRSSSL